MTEASVSAAVAADPLWFVTDAPPDEPAEDTAEPSPRAPAERRRWNSRWVQAALSLGVATIIFGFLFPKVADYGEVWGRSRP